MTISIIILTHNSEALIENCLKSAEWADEIIVFDDDSKDKTSEIAKKYTKKIYHHPLVNFPDQRTRAAANATSDWLLFLDVDERITPRLKIEIEKTIANSTYSAFKLKRQNYFFGQAIRHTGYWPDWQNRLFLRKNFKGVIGDTHESYQYSGRLGSLENYLIHFSHKNLAEGLPKSILWTRKEAQAFVAAGHPKITWWRICKVMFVEFYFRFVRMRGFSDGYVGFIESLIQAMNKFFTYQQIWELQQAPTIDDKYKKIDEKILKEWQQT